MTAHRPNILLVLADDLGRGDVSCFNSQALWQTPRLDQLGAQGMRFVDAHATSSLCTPSRYSMLTGRYNWRSRLKSSVLPGDSMSLVEKERLTLPKFLQDQGYRTAVVGKWHLGLDWQLTTGESQVQIPEAESSYLTGSDQPRMGRDDNFDAKYFPDVEGTDIDYSEPVTFGPKDLGFDYSFITAASLDQPPYVYIENHQPLGIPNQWGGDQRDLDRRSAAHQQQIQAGPMVPGYDITNVVPDFQERALATLDDLLAGDDPWFLYVPSHLVHGPIIPNEPWQGRSGVSAYGDFVLQFDDYVGQLVDRIDDAGAMEDTIVIVTSDNGASGVADLPWLREHGHDSSNGWRGHKSDIWEGGHREPLIIRWPKVIEADSVSSELVSHSDVFATVAEVLDTSLPETAAEDSVSSLEVWRGHNPSGRTDVVSHSGGGGFAIRRGDWKLALTTTGDGMDARADEAQGLGTTEYIPAQLYNLADDPGEQDNVVDENPEIVAELVEVLTDYICRGRSTPGTKQTNAPYSASGHWHQIEWMT